MAGQMFPDCIAVGHNPVTLPFMATRWLQATSQWLESSVCRVLTYLDMDIFHLHDLMLVIFPNMLG